MRVSRIRAADLSCSCGIDGGSAAGGIIGENNAGSKATASRCRLLPSRDGSGRGWGEEEEEEEEEEGNGKTKRRNARIGEWPSLNFPRENHLYPPTSILVPADRNEISICIREAGLAAVSELLAR